MGFTFRKRIKVPASFRRPQTTSTAHARGRVIAIVLVSLLAFVLALLEIDG